MDGAGIERKGCSSLSGRCPVSDETRRKKKPRKKKTRPRLPAKGPAGPAGRRDRPASQEWDEEVSSVFELSDSQIVEIREPEEDTTAEVGIWKELRRSYEAELQALGAEEQALRGRLEYEVGRLEEEVFGNAAQALKRYRRAAEHHPDLGWATRALRRRYAISGSWREVAKTLDLDLERTAAEPARSVLWEWRGRIFAHRLRNEKEAALSYQRALDLDASNQTALLSRCELLMGSPAGRELAEALQAEAAATQDLDFRAALEAEAGALLLLKQKNPGQAFERFSRALQANPRHEGARLETERLAQASQRWSELVERLVQEADLCGDRELSFGNRFLAAWIAWSRLGDADRAAELYEQAAALRPDHPLPLWELVWLYEQAGRWRALAGVIERLGKLVEPSGAARRLASLYTRLGEVHRVRLAEPEEGLAWYRKAVEIWPADVPARRALAAHYERTEQWEALAELLALERDKLEDPRQEVVALLRLARLAEEKLGDLPLAISQYERLLGLEQGRWWAQEALERIYRFQGDWKALASLLESERRLLKLPEQRAAAARRLASVLEEHLAARQRALEVRSELDPGLGAERQDLLDRARLLEAQGEWQELSRVLLKLAERTSDPQEKCWLFCRAAEVAEARLGEEASARRLYQKALGAVADSAVALAGLGRLLHAQGRWGELVQVYQAQLETAGSKDLAADLLFRMAEVQEQKLADLPAAVRTYRQALERDPEHAPALDALTDLLVRTSRWEEYLGLLEFVRSRADPVRTAMAELRAGLVLRDRLSRSKQAVERFEAASEVFPELALVALERTLAEREAWPELVALYERAEAQGLWDALRCKLRAGWVWRHHIGRHQSSREAYLEAAGLEPGNREALWSLIQVNRKGVSAAALAAAVDSLASALSDSRTSVALLKQDIAWKGIEGAVDGRVVTARRIIELDRADRESREELDQWAVESREPGSLVGVCDQEVTHGGHEGEDLVAAYVRLAEALWRTGRLESAARAYERALDLQPEDLPALRGLRLLRELQGAGEGAAELLMREGRIARNPKARVEAFMRAGDIWLVQFMDRDRAEEAYRAVFSEDPSHDRAFERLTSLVASRAGYRDLVDIYRRRLSSLEGEQRADMLVDLAHLYDERLGEQSLAVETWKEVLALRPRDTKALSALVVLYGKLEQWQEAARALEELVKADEGRRVVHLLELAKVYREKMGADEKALQAAEQALGLQPDNRRALELVADLRSRLGLWKEAAQALETLAGNAEPPERGRWLLRLADVYESGLGDKAQAQEKLVRAGAICLVAPQVLPLLEQAFLRRSDTRGLDALLQRVLQEAGPDMPGRVAVRLARARNLAQHLLKPEEAEREIQQALEEDPDSAEARLLLARLHTWAERYGMAITEYRGVLRRQPTNHEAYRGLGQALLKRGEVDRYRLACQVLSVLDRATEEEEAAAELAARALEEAPVLEGCVGPSVLVEYTSPQAEPASAREFLRALAPHLWAFYSSVRDELLRGTRAMERTHPLWETARASAVRLGLKDVEILSGPGLGLRVLGLPDRVPTVLMDKSLLSSIERRAFAFVVSRALTQVAMGSAVLELVDLKDLELTLAGVANQFDKSFGLDLAPIDELTERGKALVKLVPRRARKALETPAMLFAQAGPVGMTDWREQARIAAARAALCLCGDLRAAVSVLREEGADQEALTGLYVYNIGSRLATLRSLCGVRGE